MGGRSPVCPSPSVASVAYVAYIVSMKMYKQVYDFHTRRTGLTQALYADRSFLLFAAYFFFQIDENFAIHVQIDDTSAGMEDQVPLEVLNHPTLHPYENSQKRRRTDKSQYVR